MGMMNEIPTSSQGPKGDNAQFLQNAGIHAAYFEKFNPGYFTYTGSGSEETWAFEQYTDNPKGKWDELTGQVTDVLLVQKHSVLTGSKNIHEGELHFNAGAASQKMIMELISSASDICLFYGICVIIRLHLFSVQESRKLPLCLEHLLQTTSEITPGEQRDLSALASAVGSDLSTNRAQAAEGHLWLLSNEHQPKQLSKRRNVARNKGPVGVCKFEDYVATLEIGKYIQTRPSRNSFASSALFAEKLTDQHIPKVDAYLPKDTNRRPTVGS